MWRLPRIDCPECGRSTAISGGRLVAHNGSDGAWCPATSTEPEVARRTVFIRQGRAGELSTGDLAAHIAASADFERWDTGEGFDEALSELARRAEAGTRRKG